MSGGRGLRGAGGARGTTLPSARRHAGCPRGLPKGGRSCKRPCAARRSSTRLLAAQSVRFPGRWPRRTTHRLCCLSSTVFRRRDARKGPSCPWGRARRRTAQRAAILVCSRPPPWPVMREAIQRLVDHRGVLLTKATHPRLNSLGLVLPFNQSSSRSWHKSPAPIFHDARCSIAPSERYRTLRRLF